MDLVPVVDISDPTSTSLAALDRACRDHGFFLLTGHGLDDLFTETFETARRFFDADRSVKDAVRRDAVNPLGYNDRELTKRRRDHKEVFDLVDPANPFADRHNRWPDGVDGFRETMERHFDACGELAGRTAELVLAALGLPPEAAERTVATGRRPACGSTTTPSVTRYPPTSGTAWPTSATWPSGTTPTRACSPCSCRTTSAGPVAVGGARLDRHRAATRHRRGQSGRLHAGLDQRPLSRRRAPGDPDDDHDAPEHPLLLQPAP